MDALMVVKQLLYELLTTIWGVSTSMNALMYLWVLLAFCIGAVVILVLYHWHKTAGERKMRRARQLELDRRISDAVTTLLLKWCTADEISVKEMAELSRRVGVRLDVHDLMPGEGPKVIKQKIKRRLAAFQKAKYGGAKPQPVIPGPLPGEKVETSVTPVKGSAVVSRFFTRKPAAKAA